MARFNEIPVGRFNRALQKFFGHKGPVPSPVLATEITPNISLPLGVEFRNLETWDRFGHALALAAGAAGTTNHVRLRNPVGSNIIAIIEKVTITMPTATDTATVELGAATVDLAGLPSQAFDRFDPRGRPNPTMILSNQAVAAIPIGAAHLLPIILVNTSYDLIQDQNEELPLLPGDAFQVRNNTAVTGLGVGIWWRERFLEEGERT